MRSKKKTRSKERQKVRLQRLFYNTEDKTAMNWGKGLENQRICPQISHCEKMKTALPSLKSKIPKRFYSNVVYEVICPGCQPSYVGQTTCHLTTRMREHSRPPSHVAEHFDLCKKQLNDVEVKTIDRLEPSEISHT